MKRLKMLVLAIGLIVSGSVLATNPVILKGPTESSKEIKKLLEDPDFLVDEDMEARVLFTLNDENEIIVLSVETEFEEVDQYVKNRLSFQEIDADLEKGKQYILPFKIESKQ